MTSKITNLLLVVAIAGALMCSGFAVAQTATPPPTQPAPAAGPDPGHPRVNQVDRRLERQQDRIQQGVKNGTLTDQQAHRLASKDRRIANQESKDMAAHGGHLTAQEQKQLNQKLNNNSKKIYKEKHQ